MPVYVFQEADSKYFKIGRTKNEPASVASRLRTGNPLTLFATVEITDESACEAFFHRMLGSRRVHLGGGTEFFEVEPAEMSSTITKLQNTFSELERARAAVQELRHEACGDFELEPTQADRDTLERLHLLRTRTQALQTEIELLELRLKQRIGAASGIRGIATWRTQLRRCYDEDLFRSQNRDLFEAVLERFHRIDTTRWMREDKDLYKAVQTAHYRPSLTRLFRLTGKTGA